VQRYWFDTGTAIGVMWIPGAPTEDMVASGQQHIAEDGNPAGPIYNMPAAANAGQDQAALEDGAGLDDGEPVWEEEDAQGDQPAMVSVKDARDEADGMPALEGPVGAWGGDKDFGSLGSDEPVTAARIDRPVPPLNHVSFWCKVGDVDVRVHLTQSGYKLVYGARDAPGDATTEATRDGLTGRDLYAAFLQIAQTSGPYREGANECQTFAQSMLDKLTEAIDDAGDDGGF
jgi:hypothetical protein